MAKIFRSSFYPLEEEEESLAGAAAGEYRDLEDGSGGKDCANGDETPGSGGGARRDDDTICFVAYLASCVSICYVLLGSFYLPPEAGADGGGVIVVLGCVFLAVAGPVLVRSGRFLLLPLSA